MSPVTAHLTLDSGPLGSLLQRSRNINLAMHDFLDFRVRRRSGRVAEGIPLTHVNRWSCPMLTSLFHTSKVKGDGHTYIASVRIDQLTGGDEEAWQAPLPTRWEAWQAPLPTSAINTILPTSLSLTSSSHTSEQSAVPTPALPPPLSGPMASGRT